MSVKATPHVLVIEDDEDLAGLAELHLRDAHFDVTVAHRGDEGLRLAEGGAFDLIVLDLMLPEIEGLELCRRLRASGDAVPILITTARGQEMDRVLGLETGADDYLTKPFGVRELVARVRALLRRQSWNDAPRGEETASLHYGELVIETGRHAVIRDGETLDLTPREFALLVHFARHAGQVFSRRQLLDSVWGYSYSGYEHTVNTHINRLRAKIERDPTDPRYVQTVWGVGYRFGDANGEVP